MSKMKKLYLASCNLAKAKATKEVFDDFDIELLSVDVNNPKQPLSELETIECAKRRARALPNGYRLGLEAGTTIIDDKCFLVNFGVLIDPNNNEYIAGGSYLELPECIKHELYDNGLELKDAMNKHYSGLKEEGGAINIFTNGKVNRVDIFLHICKILKGELERKEKENG